MDCDPVASRQEESDMGGERNRAGTGSADGRTERLDKVLKHNGVPTGGFRVASGFFQVRRP